jgi:putative transposase
MPLKKGGNMSWGVSKVEEKRREFIDQCHGDTAFLTDICREFGISRKTAYKWLRRYEEEGVDGLKDRSKAPHRQSQKTNEEAIRHILALKKQKEAWGPKKIRARLEEDWPMVQFPSVTTIGNILEQHGLTVPRKYRRRYPGKTDPLSHCQKPNDVWCIDFKGWFKTKDAIKCDPLTLTDAHSRYILYCSKLNVNSAEHVWDVLSRAFKEYGLPRYLRHDNGPPFATAGAGRLSRLSVKLVKAGIIPEWIEPGKPYQNGRHERMHLTLKKEGASPLQLTLQEQQLRFVAFLRYFNHERPHEALGQKTPASVYEPSERKWTGKLQIPEYSSDFQVKRVREKGHLSWYGTDIFIGKTLGNEPVGLKENEDGDWLVYFGPVFLGIIDHEKQFIQPRMKSERTRFYKQVVY